MSYITHRQLSDKIDLPVALPITELKRANWLIIATMQLSPPMKLSYKWLNLQLVSTSYSDQNIAIIDPSRGLCYVGIYKNFNGGEVFLPVGTNEDVIFTTAVGTVSKNPDTELELTVTEPTTFSFVAVNNTSNAELRLVVNGQARLDISPV
jgi:hypothetical protein